MMCARKRENGNERRGRRLKWERKDKRRRRREEQREEGRRGEGEEERRRDTFCEPVMTMAPSVGSASALAVAVFSSSIRVSHSAFSACERKRRGGRNGRGVGRGGKVRRAWMDAYPSEVNTYDTRVKHSYMVSDRQVTQAS